MLRSNATLSCRPAWIPNCSWSERVTSAIRTWMTTCCGSVSSFSIIALMSSRYFGVALRMIELVFDSGMTITCDSKSWWSEIVSLVSSRLRFSFRYWLMELATDAARTVRSWISSSWRSSSLESFRSSAVIIASIRRRSPGEPAATIALVRVSTVRRTGTNEVSPFEFGIAGIPPGFVARMDERVFCICVASPLRISKIFSCPVCAGTSSASISVAIRSMQSAGAVTTSCCLYGLAVICTSFMIPEEISFLLSASTERTSRIGYIELPGAAPAAAGMMALVIVWRRSSARVFFSEKVRTSSLTFERLTSISIRSR